MIRWLALTLSIVPQGLWGCTTRTSTPAAITKPTSAVAPLPVSSSTTGTPKWATGSLTDQLYALRITEDNWARGTFYSWTTLSQVEEIGIRKNVLLSTANMRGAKSPFVWLVEHTANAKGNIGALARLLAHDARFQKRRYAWSSGYPTVLGLSLKRYGTALIHIQLRHDAWVAHLGYDRTPSFAIRDLEQHDIPLEEALKQPDRIGAVYHVRTGKDVAARFREYVLVNEGMIESFSVGTPEIHAEIRDELALMELLQRQLTESGEKPTRDWDLPGWRHTSTSDGLNNLWDSTLTFPIERYEPNLRSLTAIKNGLLDYAATVEPLTVHHAAR